ncbi:MAG: YdcF family protein [Bacteroidetes bacterium]|nr:YdcF family protein [Bacteroidota bacterium]
MGFILNPFFWILVLLTISLATKNIIKRKRLIFISLILVFVFGNGVLVNEIGLLKENKWREAAKKYQTYPDTAVLLGGFCYYNNELNRVEFSESSDRLFQILKLYQSHRIGTLIISGGSGSLRYPKEKEAIMVENYLREGQFRTDSLLIEAQSRNTYENAQFTKELIGLSNPNILLVTSAFHMDRAMRVFSKAGFNPQPYPTNFIFEPMRDYTFETFILPKAKNFEKWELLIKENVGSMVYRIKGYL